MALLVFFYIIVVNFVTEFTTIIYLHGLSEVGPSRMDI